MVWELLYCEDLEEKGYFKLLNELINQSVTEVFVEQSRVNRVCLKRRKKYI